MSAVVDAANARVDRALDACAKAEAEAVAAALHLMVLRAREYDTAAVAVRLSWSDQGDFLHVDGLDGPGGEDLDWYDEECLAWNFGGHLEARWLTFMQASTRETNRASFLLPIEPTLDHFNRQEGL